jgi:virginiamycin B lyase
MKGYKLAAGSIPASLTSGNDGTLWYVDDGSNSLVHVVAPGKYAQFAAPDPYAELSAICQDATGTVWFIETNQNKIGRMTPTGAFEEFSIPTASSNARDIIVGPDGALWFTELVVKIGRMTTSGKFIELPVVSQYAEPDQLTVGSDKNVWFTEEQGYDGILGRVELNNVKDSQPVYSSFTLIALGRPQLGVPASIPLRIEVRNLHNKVLKGAYPYPVHITTTDRKNASPTPGEILSSSTKVAVNSSGHYTDANIGADADGGGREYPASIVPSAPREYKLPSPSFNLTAGAQNSVWMCLENGSIASRSSGGSISVYHVTTSFSEEGCSMVEGPDGNVWFTDYSNDRIGKITPQGQVTFNQLEHDASPLSITLGPDGALWFTENFARKIGRLTTDGSLRTFGARNSPLDIVAGSDGNLWFNDDEGGIYKMSTQGVKKREKTVYELGSLWSTAGSLWYWSPYELNQLSTTGKVVKQYKLPINCIPFALTSAPDGNLWYYDPGYNCVGRLSPSGTLVTVPTFYQKNGNLLFAGIIYGPNHDLWFAEPNTKGLGWIDPKTM